MNALFQRSMHEAVDRLCDEVDGIVGVVVTSAKKTFFAGGNLGLMTQATPADAPTVFDAALKSYRLALRDHPNDPRILHNIELAFSRTGRMNEAVSAYRRALDADPELSGAHYGLAFLQLKRGDLAEASAHLEAFLEAPPAGAEAERWVLHARQTLDELRAQAAKLSDTPEE